MIDVEHGLVRVLVVDDDEDDYFITREMLAGHEQARFAVDWCAGYHEALATIRERRHDVYLIDYRLGKRTGLELVREGFAPRSHAPVIVLTGQGGFEVDLGATALGVADYLDKQGLDPAELERSIRYAIKHQRLVDELTRCEERYALAVRATNDGIWDWDVPAGRIYLSPRWHAILGLPERFGDADPAAWFDLVHEDDLVRLRQAIDAHLAGATPYLEVEHRMRRADGTWLRVRSRGLAVRGIDGKARRMAGSLTDISDRRQT